MQVLAAAAGAGLSVPTITSVNAAYTTAAVTFATVAGATSYTVTAVGAGSTTGSSSPLTITGLSNYSSYYFTVSATDGSTTVTSAQFGPVTVAVPCPYGTQASPYCTYYTTSGGGATCTYNYICNGAGGFALEFCSGPCYTLSGGDYCSGCYPAQ
jgi:hypothetical protein